MAELTVNVLYYMLRDLEDHWYKIGLMFNVDQNKLNGIRAGYHNKSERCMIAMLSCWLGQHKRSLKDVWETLKIGDQEQLAGKVKHYLQETHKLKEQKEHYKRRLVPLSDYAYEEWWLKRNLFEVAYTPTEKSINGIIRCLKKAAARWFAIGLALQIPKSELEIVDCDYQDSERKLREMISILIKGGECTWMKLIDTLHDMNLGDIARSIEVEARDEGGKFLPIVELNHIPLIITSKDFIEHDFIDESPLYSEYMGNIRKLVCPPDDVSDENFMKNLEYHTSKKEDLGYTGLKNIVNENQNIARLQEKDSEQLQQKVDQLKKKREKIRNTRAELIMEQDNLEMRKEGLERRRTDICEHIETHREDSSKITQLQQLQQNLKDVEEELTEVKKLLEECTKKLALVDLEYKSIKNELFQVRKEIDICMEKVKRCKKYAEYCKNKALGFFSTLCHSIDTEWSQCCIDRKFIITECEETLSKTDDTIRQLDKQLEAVTVLLNM